MDFSDIRDRVMKDVVPQIKHFVGSSWTPERIARAVGAEVRGRETSIVTPILLIAVGALIGGGVAQAGPALFDPLNRFLERFEWRPGGHQVRIAPAQLGDLAGAYGAARNAQLPTR